MKIVILNKPYDVLSQFRKDEAHMTVSDFVDDPTLRLAGRLDMDSEGLVFLTDHGGLNQYITNPENKKFKTYLVQVDGDVTEEALEKLRQGVELKDGMTLPAKASKVEEPEWLWERDPPVRYRANVPKEEPYRSRSYVKKPGGTGGKPMVRKNKDGSVKKSGTKRIWQMDESEKPKRRTNGTTRPNTKAPRGSRSRNGRG